MHIITPFSKHFVLSRFQKNNTVQKDCFQYFKSDIGNYELPKRFNFPFYYEPHPLCVLAANELQEHLLNQKEWKHNFGLPNYAEGTIIGKMFGVLVVENQEGKIGYLAAFSGKLAGGNHHDKFVPPVFDMLTKDGYFKQEEMVVSSINKQLEVLEKNPDYWAFQKKYENSKVKAAEQIEEHKEKIRQGRKKRKAQRIDAKDKLSETEYQDLLNRLSKESVLQKYYLKDLTTYWEERLNQEEQELRKFTDDINRLRQERKDKSSALQDYLFQQYQFLNKAGKRQDLLDIFSKTAFKVPPAGAGECAAPKLLQYAFLHDLRPISMAEFWWGQSPKSEIRQHGRFYPACKGKCEPILGHMLQGIEMDENPMLKNPAEGKEISIVYEDEFLAVINKPADFLSVPGKNIEDSVYLRVKKRYPDASGPLIVHRLDMSTSGLLLIAKSSRIHKQIQRQFIDRTVKKRYTALLDDIIKEDKGMIDLPLVGDVTDRPRQMVSAEHGKPARTYWKVIERREATTLIHFFPITGRTHQLRVHAAHHQGLNTPILGDDLYGKKANRLHLHAEWIEFLHPVTQKRMSMEVKAEF